MKSANQTYILIVTLNDDKESKESVEKFINNDYVSAVIYDDYKILKKDSALDSDIIPNIISDIKSEELSLFLRRLNLLPNHSGFHYLITAIAYQLSNPGQPVYITKYIYPYVAKKFNSTPSRVERCMRNAIDYSWQNDGCARFEEIAGFHITKKPTNSQFISLAAEYIRMHKDNIYG